MFNEKALKQYRNKLDLPRKLDRLDHEAGKEGDAIRIFSKNWASGGPVGKRLQKNRNAESRGAAIVGSKRVENFIVDHLAAVEKYMVRG